MLFLPVHFLKRAREKKCGVGWVDGWEGREDLRGRDLDQNIL